MTDRDEQPVSRVPTIFDHLHDRAIDQSAEHVKHPTSRESLIGAYGLGCSK